MPTSERLSFVRKKRRLISPLIQRATFTSKSSSDINKQNDIDVKGYRRLYEKDGLTNTQPNISDERGTMLNIKLASSKGKERQMSTTSSRPGHSLVEPIKFAETHMSSSEAALPCASSSLCTDCPELPVCRIGSGPSYEECCTAPCPVACSPPSSIPGAPICSAIAACCDEEEEVVACEDVHCTTTCDDARCAAIAGGDSLMTSAKPEKCLVVCEGILSSSSSSSSAQSPTNVSKDAPPCTSCVDSSGNKSAPKHYASFQELLDCWCCSDHELDQCCSTNSIDCSGNAKDCDECYVEGGEVPHSVISMSTQQTPMSISRSRTTSISISSFNSPTNNQELLDTASSSTWANNQQISNKEFTNHNHNHHQQHQQQQQQQQTLLQCIFDQAHSHNEQGACLAPSMTLHDDSPYHVSVNSFATHHTHPHLHICHWAGCGMQCQTISDLTDHVNSVHLVAPGGQVSAANHRSEEEEEESNTIQWTQDQAWKCLWDSCQANHSDESMGMGMGDGSLVLQHILQAHVGVEDHLSPASSSTKRKREVGMGEGSSYSLAHDCGCPTSIEGTGVIEHPCGWKDCTLSFSSHEALTHHITETHVGSGKSEYECHWIGCSRGDNRKFYQKQKILRHLQTHTGHRPFICPICDKRFSEANTLSQHQRTHTNEKPYRCDFEGCGKSFAVAGSLTIHKRIHTGEKPFKCTWEGCNRAFSESSNLTKHLRVHTGERPFPCPIPGCSKRFSRPDQVARHKKTHEKEKGVNSAA